MMNNGYQAVTDNCRVDLDADCVFGVSPELLDLQMLLHPFEEQLLDSTLKCNALKRDSITLLP